MAENPIGGSPLDPGASADVGRAVGNVKINSKAAIDVAAFKNLNKEFKQLNTYVTKFQADLPKLIEGTRKWAAELGKVARNLKSTAGAGGAGGGSYMPDAGTVVGSNNIYNVTKSVTINEAPGGGGVGGGGVGGGPQGIRELLGPRGQIAAALGQAAFNGMLGRVDRNIPFALGADRMSMLYQQMYGMSQNQVYNSYRKPLTSYLLGPNGGNELMGLQAQTGLSALLQARSVEAMRAASGFQYSTSDITGMTRALATPQANNMMFMMLGTGMYGIGGAQRTQQQVYQDIIRRTGLTTEKAVQGAFQQGSTVRARLEASGLPAEQTDLLLQYAQQNVAYRKKGGKGFYDPANAAHREFMGVGEGQYATQAEETERTRSRREEKFYNQQADNYAAMERNTQQLERLGSMIDNWLSKVYGVGIQQKPRFGLIKKGVGLGMMVAGGVISAGSAGTASPLGMGLLVSGAGMLTGDPVKMDGKDAGPSNVSGGSSGGPVPENVKKSEAALSQLNPRFASRLRKMLYANPKLYVNEGLRSSATQKAEFLRRYKPTSEKTDTFWNGTYWKHVKGAPAAPPGMSMHEIGLAADLGPVEEFGWITANSDKFGLRNFADVNNEPWHVQPNDIPGGRSEYERKGSPWGTKGEKFDASAVIGGTPAASYYGTETVPTGSGGGAFAYSEMSMSDIVGMQVDKYSGISSSPGSVSAMAVTGSSTGSDAVSTSSGRALSGAEVAKLLYKAGFRGKNLQTAVAIAFRESNFDPNAHNTRNEDNSYGLMQINMKDNGKTPNMGKARAKRFALSSYNQLFDPATNARVAYELWSGRTTGEGNMPGAGWAPWGGENSVSKTNLKNAASYIKEAKITGDPVMAGGSRSGSVTNVGGASYNITIAPSITVAAGAGGGVDVQKLAKEVVSLMEREVRMTMMRVS